MGFEAVVYHVNRDGVIEIPIPDTTPPKPGFQKMYAGTLGEIDILQHRLEQQEREQLERLAQRDESVWSAKREAIRSSLYQRMISSSTSAYEREFIGLYLKLREERRLKYQQRFLEYTCYSQVREMGLQAIGYRPSHGLP